MTLPVVDEAPRADVADAVTFAFADVAAGVSGLARAGFTEDGLERARRRCSPAPIPIAARADTSTGTDGRAWEAVDAAGVRTTVVEPGRAWTVAFDDGEGHGFALEVTAISPPADLGDGVGGMTGYDHLCRVEGDVRTGSGTVRVSCLGQRGRLWGSPDWTDLELTRSVGVWLDGDAGSRCTRLAPPAPRARTQEVCRATVFDGERALRRRRPAGLHRLRRRGPPAPRGPGALGPRRGLPPPRRGRARRRHVARPRPAAAGLRVPALAHGGPEGAGRYDILRRVG